MYSDSFVIIYILHAYLHSRLEGWFDRLHCRRPCGTEDKGVGYGFMPLAEKYFLYLFCNIHTADHTLILSMLCLLRKKHNNSAAKVVIFIWFVQMFFVFLSENPQF